jgi:hypothetical protein
MNIRMMAYLLVIAIAVTSCADLTGFALDQAASERLDLRPLSFEEVAVAGGYTQGLFTDDDDGAWLTTGRLIQPINLADPESPDIAGPPERLPLYLSCMSRRAGVAWACDFEGLWRRDPAAVGDGIWQRAWRIADGAPVSADNSQNSFDYVRQIILPADRPELILLLTRGGLRVLEVDGMGVPVELAFVPRSTEQHWTIDIAYAQGRAYFLESWESTVTLRSLDLTDPATPTEAGIYQIDYDDAGLPSQALWDWMLRAEGQHIYLAGADRLVVIAAPAAMAPGIPLPPPQELGRLSLDTRPWNLLPDGDRLWLIERETVLDPPALRGIDVADRTQPRWLGAPVTLEPTYRIPEHYLVSNENHSPGIGLARAEEYLLLSDGPGGQLRSVDVRDPAAPRIVGQIDRLGDCQGTIHVAGWTYCSAADGLIPLADSEGRPVLAQTAGAARESLAYPAAVAIEDNVAWLDSETGRLRIYGIDPPALPILYAELELGDAYLLEVADHYLYVASGKAGQQHQADQLLVVDVHDLQRPTVVQELELPVEGVVSSAVGDGTLFLSSYDEGIVAYDLGMPSDPRLVGRYHGIPDIRPDIAWHAGSLVVFPHGSGRGTDVIILDASDPAQLRERSRFGFDDFHVVAQNNVIHAVDEVRGEIYVYVYRSDSAGVAVLNVNDPDNVRRVADFQVDSVTAITLDGDRVFVSSENAGVSIWERRVGELPPTVFLPFIPNAQTRFSP